jgi:adiponectin receptor
MGLAVAVIPKERWDVIAGVIIVGTGLGYVAPAVHWLLISEQGWNAVGRLFITQIVLTGVAVVFYTKYVPECFAPGKFDLIGHSHQLWHVAIYLSIALMCECMLRVESLIDAGNFCI